MFTITIFLCYNSTNYLISTFTLFLALFFLYSSLIDFFKYSIKLSKSNKIVSYFYMLNDVLLFKPVYDDFNNVHEYSFPSFIEESILMNFKNPFDFFIYKTGKENMPLSTLIGFSASTDETIFNIGSATYYHIFYTHYMADLQLASVVSEELYTGKYVTFRNTYSEYVQHYYKRQFCKSNHIRTLTHGSVNHEIHELSDICRDTFHTVGELPNSLGITGIVKIGDYYVIQKREKESVEGGSLTWSFSGLISLYNDINYNTGNSTTNYTPITISVLSYLRSELVDELLNPLVAGAKNWEDDKLEGIAKTIPISLVFNGVNLYQFELCVYIELDMEYPSTMELGNEVAIASNYEDLTKALDSKSKYILITNNIINGDYLLSELNEEKYPKSSLFDVILLSFQRWQAKGSQAEPQ